MREAIRSFVSVLAAELPDPIYEFGSLQVEGQEGFADLRVFFPGRKYFGCDMRSGKGVDIVLNLHKIDLPDATAGTVLLLDTLEHVEFCREAMAEIFRILRPGGIVVASSVMNFRIHDYPCDYWRFTPEGFKSLLRDFPCSMVEYLGKKDFPHTVVGVGIKGGLSELSMRALERKLVYWKQVEVESETPNLIREGVKSLLPPVLLAVYRWFMKFIRE